MSKYHSTIDKLICNENEDCFIQRTTVVRTYRSDENCRIYWKSKTAIHVMPLFRLGRIFCLIAECEMEAYIISKQPLSTFSIVFLNHCVNENSIALVY